MSETIGARIRTLRTSLGLSMEELAHKILIPTKIKTEVWEGDTKAEIRTEYSLRPVTSGTISNIENDKNKPSAELVIAFSDFFNVSCDWILKGKEFVVADASPDKVDVTDDGKIILTVKQYEEQIKRYDEVIQLKAEVDKSYAQMVEIVDQVTKHVNKFSRTIEDAREDSKKEHD